MCIKVQPLTLALPKCVHLPYLRYVSLVPKIYGFAATEYYMYFYIIVLFPLIAVVLLLTNFTAS